MAGDKLVEGNCVDSTGQCLNMVDFVIGSNDHFLTRPGLLRATLPEILHSRPTGCQIHCSRTVKSAYVH